MAAKRPRFSLRFKLIGVFGLLLAAGLSMLIVDEFAEQRSGRALAALKDQSLAGQRRLTAVFDAYAVEITDMVWKVSHGRMGWAQAAAVIDNAALRIALHAKALEEMPRSAEQQLLFEQLVRARKDADLLVEKIREQVAAKDAAALRKLGESELYAAFDPVTSRLRFLTDLELVQAERLVQQADRRAWTTRWLRVVVIVLMLSISALVGRQILRNIFRGVESLVKLARTVQERNYERAPSYRPSGELGEVMDAFLDMRGALRANEADLRASMQLNEAVRQQLQERERFQRSLLGAAQIGIFSVDRDGRFTHLNPFAEALFGYAEGELLGTATPDLLFEPAQLARIADELAPSVGHPVPADWRLFLTLADQDYPPIECQLRRRDGSQLTVLQVASMLQDENGALIGLLFVATDLTELKKLEDELRLSEARAQEANRAKSSFLAAMSHELRTPLIGVTGMVEVLGHTRLDPEQQDSLRVIQDSADALLQIIGDILDLSKIEAGRMELAPAVVALRQLVAQVTHAHRGNASAKGLALDCAIAAEVAAAHRVDPLRLRQILGNFISNAVKFTERGRIDVRVRQVAAEPAAQWLEFSVTDTGIGISAEAQQRLFSAFGQAEADTTRRFGGSGLGLVICQRLARLMGGEVELESREGVGTTLRLRLRLDCADPRELDQSAAQAGTGSGDFEPRPLPSPEAAEAARSLVLLVDDHPTNRRVVERQLQLAGWRCEAAEDGEQGLALWRSGRFALVLTDLHMPRRDGFWLVRAIREEERARALSRTPVVALTAAALLGEAERCHAAGMDDFLTKPVSLATLDACLGRWLPHRPLAAPAAGAHANVDPAGLPFLSAALMEVSGGDRLAARAILEDFLDTSDLDLRALGEALAAANCADATRSAHRVCGAARLVGATRIAQAAAQIEDAGRVKDHAAMEQRLPELCRALAQLREWAAAGNP